MKIYQLSKNRVLYFVFLETSTFCVFFDDVIENSRSKWILFIRKHETICILRQLSTYTNNISSVQTQNTNEREIISNTYVELDLRFYNLILINVH